jgi:hypothetical protein
VWLVKQLARRSKSAGCRQKRRLGRPLGAAAETATQGLAFAEPMNSASIAWRLRRARSIAFGQRADEAAAEFRVLADRITEPELSRWFDRQPLAPR